mmetsp:Transcript_48123/g.124774  ORF Transcript_48123/g.124774 Transcript_48123/m.124774 type:complete len:268 (-) Transcript_48123:755-1558(-)
MSRRLPQASILESLERVVQAAVYVQRPHHAAAAEHRREEREDAKQAGPEGYDDGVLVEQPLHRAALLCHALLFRGHADGAVGVGVGAAELLVLAAPLLLLLGPALLPDVQPVLAVKRLVVLDTSSPVMVAAPGLLLFGPSFPRPEPGLAIEQLRAVEGGRCGVLIQLRGGCHHRGGSRPALRGRAARHVKAAHLDLLIGPLVLPIVQAVVAIIRRGLLCGVLDRARMQLALHVLALRHQAKVLPHAEIDGVVRRKVEHVVRRGLVVA